jgi:DNA-binding winged helix-turn-helix (wHTH) protein
VAASFAFEGFVLDTQERRLLADDQAIELNGRYLDALALMVGDCGKLVSKDRFLDEVWRGIPVTDEALTQCIKTLRRALGDDASRPRFIETVPKHGYRFIAPVEVVGNTPVPVPRDLPDSWRQFMVTGAAGTLGGAIAGVIGGLVYGFAGASEAGVGAISVLLVLLCATALIGIIGAAGVSFAIATMTFVRSRSLPWLALAGAAGGLFVGAFGKLLGHDSFALLVGRSPGEITGAMEGLILGAAVGAGAWFAFANTSLRRSAALAGLAGAMAGLAIALLGGRLMLGSLELLAQAFPNSRLRLDHVGRLFGESGFGPITAVASTVVEAALFAACVVAAMTIGRRRYLKRP